MGNEDFHDKAYDAGTLAKLNIFELYTQEWIPVFVSNAIPPFEEVHIFDFFSGPGTDSLGNPGSPLRILRRLRSYYDKGMAGWNRVTLVVHFFDDDSSKIQRLDVRIKEQESRIPGVQIDCRSIAFCQALNEHEQLLLDRRIAKLLIIDQYGVDQVSDEVFRRLIQYPTADFIFFLSSSTLHRFRNHPAIKQKIDVLEDSYDVHRAAVDYYRKLIPTPNKVYLAPFSIRKRSNIYGLIFGSQHPLGIHKFLEVAWQNDEIAGEANFDIDRENIRPEEGILALDVMRPTKIREFETELERALRRGDVKDEADIARFCIEYGMTCRHSTGVLKRLKAEGIISSRFTVPDVRNLKKPRAVKLL